MKRWVVGVLPLLGIVAACGGGSAASGLAKPPEYAPKGQTKCSAKASTLEPLIVEWPSAARGQLEAIVENHRGIAVVHYEGCEMKVLPACTAPGKVSYVPFRNQKQDAVRIRNADDLYASLPVGAAALEARLEKAGELTVDVTLVGRYEADAVSLSKRDLTGDCGEATHVIRAVTVGAFDFHTGASASVAGGAKVGSAGAGGASRSDQDTLAKDGSAAACEKAAGGDTDPPMNCGALVRIEVVPLGTAIPAAATASVAAPTATAPSPAQSTPAAAPVPTLAPADQQMRDALLGSWRVRRYTDGGAYVTFTKDGTMVVTTRGKCANGTKAMAIQCKPIGFTVTDGELRLAEAATPPLSETERCGGVRVLPGTGTASNYSVRMGDLFGPSTLAPAAGWYAYRWAIHKSQPPMLMIEKTPIERIDERVDLMGEW